MFLGDIYDRITTNEIRMKDSNPTGGGGGADMKRSASSLDGKSRLAASNASNAGGVASNGQSGGTSAGSQMNGSMSADSHSGDSSLSSSPDKQTEGGSGQLFYLSSDADISVIQPMFDLLWFPALATFSMILEESDADVWIELCCTTVTHMARV